MSEVNGQPPAAPNDRARKAATALAQFWARLRLILMIQTARFRFFAVLAVIGLVIVNWDRLTAQYEKWVRADSSTETASIDVEFFCPMHPSIVRENNHEKCPICFMPLSKRKKGEASGESLPPGIASRLQLSPYRIALAGVRTVPVAYQELHKEIVTVGSVEFDERGLYNVPSRVKGRIDRLYVNQTGQLVAKGEPLALLYSPDLVVTVQNLLDAIRAGNADLQKNSRDRLRLWGIDDKEIDAIASAGKPIDQLTIRSPIAGHVIKKYQRQGQYVEEGATLYDIADISKVWLQAQIYEEDLAFLPKGSHDSRTGGVARKLRVSARSRALPGREYVGNLSFIFPHVDPETRTLTVRLELDNVEHELRPGMSATVVIQVAASDLDGSPAANQLRSEKGKVLAIPEECIIDTGKEKVVYREDLPGVFDGVFVELGPRMTASDGGAYFPVLAGLQPGDAVAAAGSFLIDAETRLNPALSSVYVGGSSGKGSSSTGTATLRPTDPENKEAMLIAALNKLSPADRALAETQKWCPILEGTPLGSMGVPIKVELNGEPIFVCCRNCVNQSKTNPTVSLERARDLKKKRGQALDAASIKLRMVQENLAKLSEADERLAKTQAVCPVTRAPLGSMGKPSKVVIGGQAVFTCCEDCNEDVLARPDEMLQKLKDVKQRKPVTK